MPLKCEVFNPLVKNSSCRRTQSCLPLHELWKLTANENWLFSSISLTKFWSPKCENNHDVIVKQGKKKKKRFFLSYLLLSPVRPRLFYSALPWNIQCCGSWSSNGRICHVFPLGLVPDLHSEETSGMLMSLRETSRLTSTVCCRCSALQEPCISFAIIPEKMNKSSTFHGETHCQRPFPRCSKHSLLIIFIYLCSVYTKIFLSSENLGLCWYHSKTEECKFFLY